MSALADKLTCLNFGHRRRKYIRKWVSAFDTLETFMHHRLGFQFSSVRLWVYSSKKRNGRGFEQTIFCTAASVLGGFGGDSIIGVCHKTK